MARRRRLVMEPPLAEKPPSLPPAATTRWQGTHAFHIQRDSGQIARVTPQQGLHIGDDALDVRWWRGFDDSGKALGDAGADRGCVVLGQQKANNAALVPSKPTEADGGLEERVERRMAGWIILHALL